MRIVAAHTRIARWSLDGAGAARGRTERIAAFLDVTTDDGRTFTGEAAPLPGLSPDSLDDAIAALDAFAAHVAHAPLDLADFDLASLATRTARFAPHSPSARFALETALLAASRAHVDADADTDTDADTGAATARRIVVLAPSVVVDDVDEAVRAVQGGARFLKIKVGPGLERDRVASIARAAPRARLRLDANRSWPRADARAYLAALAELPIDYVEEPCLDAHELLAEPLAIPIALDESLTVLAMPARADATPARADAPPARADAPPARPMPASAAAAAAAATPTSAATQASASAARVEAARAGGDDADRAALLEGALSSPGLAALVLKPTLLGGFSACLDLARRAAAHRKPVIVTHALESPVGRAAVEAIAAALKTGDGPRFHASADQRADTTCDKRRRTTQPMRATRKASVVVAHPTQATVDAIARAFAEQAPIALLHPRAGEEELARQRAVVARAELRDGEAVILFTSGSTGTPRGVVHTWASIEASIDASAVHFGWRDDDRWLLALSTAHAGGLSVVVRCLAAGKPIVRVEREGDRAVLVAALADSTLASLVPTQLAMLLDDPAWRPAPALRAILLGGAAAPRALLDDAAARRVPFVSSYGLTETFGQVATAPLDRAGDPDAPLVALGGVVLEAGTRTAPGPIRVRGPTLAARYLDDTPIAPVYTTADLGFLDGRALHVVGRADRVIITGGENVHPTEVETALAATRGVKLACVFGVPDPRWGQLVAAAVAVDATFDQDEAVAAWVALAPHQRPRELAVLAALPQLPSGKLDYARAAQLPRVPVRYPRSRR